MERACFCIVRRRVTMLRLRSDRFKVWRARLVADLVLAIGDQKKIAEMDARKRIEIVNPKQFVQRSRVQWAKRYKLLPNASFAFSRSPASVPPIRICSTVSVAEADVASACGC